MHKTLCGLTRVVLDLSYMVLDRASLMEYAAEILGRLEPSELL